MRSQTEITADAIARELDSDEPAVIILSGDWGSGKTHLWREGISPQLKKPQATVSVFGASSANAIRNALAIAALGAQAKGRTRPSLEQLKAFGIGATQLISELTTRVADTTIRAKLFGSDFDALTLLPRGTIYCIDDLERLAPSISLKEVIGISNYLCEKRGCSVLVVVNEQELASHSETSLKEFKTYKERIASAQYHLLPDLERAFDLISDGSTTRRHAKQWRTAILDTFRKSGVKNLRTLRRAMDHVARLQQLVGSNLDAASVHTLVALRCELDEGVDRPNEFYNFNAGLVSQAFDTTKEPNKTNAERRDFLTRYFMSSEKQYRYREHTATFVRTGLMDPTALAIEYAPPKSPSKLESLLAELRVGSFVGFTDSQALSTRIRLREMAGGEQHITVFSLISAWVYDCLLGEMLALNPDQGYAQNLAGNIEHKVRDGDTTWFDDNGQVVFMDRADWVMMVTGTVNEALDDHLLSKSGIKIDEAIASGDVELTMRCISHSATGLTALCTPNRLSKLMDAYREKREFVSAIRFAKEQLSKHTPASVPSLMNRRRQFASALHEIAIAPWFQESDQWRMKKLVEETTPWLA